MLNVDCIPAFEDNYIWLVHTGANRAVVVDPGEAAPVLEALHERGLQAEAILITHHHRDHTGGVAALLANRPVPVYGPAIDAIPGRTDAVADGDRICFSGGIEFQVLATPGHTRGHVCYVGHGALFCGDTLFTGGCGRLFEGTAEQMHASLEKLRALPDDTLVYCAHEYTESSLAFAAVAEPNNDVLHARRIEVAARRRAGEATVPSGLGLEKQTNPFLRSHEPALISAAEAFAGRRLASGAEVFGAVRHWKDTLD
jgi:hydroxyacylglutathione hydrolase